MRYLLIIACMYFVVGCRAANRVLSYAHTNPSAVTMAINICFVRYVIKGETEQDRALRVEKLKALIAELDHFLIGNPVSSAQTIVEVITAHIDFEVLTMSDQVLAKSIMRDLQEILLTQEKAGYLDSDAVIKLRVMLRDMQHTAVRLQ